MHQNLVPKDFSRHFRRYPVTHNRLLAKLLDTELSVQPYRQQIVPDDPFLLHQEVVDRPVRRDESSTEEPRRVRGQPNGYPSHQSGRVLGEPLQRTRHQSRLDDSGVEADRGDVRILRRDKRHGLERGKFGDRVRRDARADHHRESGGQADDGSSLLGSQDLQEVLRHECRSFGVDILKWIPVSGTITYEQETTYEIAPPFGEDTVLKRNVFSSDDSGVVHQNIDGAETALDRLKESRHPSFVADINGHGEQFNVRGDRVDLRLGGF